MSSLLKGITIERKGLKQSYFGDIYYWVLKNSWSAFFLVSVFIYLSMNLFFAGIYFMLGDAIQNADPNSFWDAYLFSFQTSSTLGYGYFLPKTPMAHIITIFDTLSGVLYVAIITGLAYAKFSKPTTKVLFSDNAIIAKYDGVDTLTFRIANGRLTHISDAGLNVVVLLPYESKEGIKMQRFNDLKLHRQHSPLFSLTWTVMHTIDSESPLYGKSIEQLQSERASIIISFNGIDDVYSQTVHANHNYRASEIIRAKKFSDMIEIHEGNRRVIDYSKFHSFDL